MWTFVVIEKFWFCKQLRYNEEWKNFSTLNSTMQSCLHESFPQDERRYVINNEYYI